MPKRQIATLESQLTLDKKSFEAGIASVNQSLAKLSNTMEKTLARKAKKGAKEANKAINSIPKSYRKSIKAVSRITSGILISQVFYRTVQAVQELTSEIIQFSGNMEKAMISFTTLLDGNRMQAGKLLDQLEELAALTPIQITPLRNAAQQLIAMGLNAETVVGVLERMVDATSAVGGGAEQLRQMSNVFSRIIGKGVISSRDIRSLVSAGIPIFQILREQLGLTGDQIREIGKLRIDAETAITAILRGFERFEGLSEELALTLPGLVSTLKDNILFLGRTIAEAPYEAAKNQIREILETVRNLRQIGKEAGARGVFNQILGPDVTSDLIAVGNSLKTIYASLRDIWSVIGPLVAVLAKLSLKVLKDGLERVSQALGDLAIITKAVGDLFGQLSPILQKVRNRFLEQLPVVGRLIQLYNALFGLFKGNEIDFSALETGGDTISEWSEEMDLLSDSVGEAEGSVKSFTAAFDELFRVPDQAGGGAGGLSDFFDLPDIDDDLDIGGLTFADLFREKLEIMNSDTETTWEKIRNAFSDSWSKLKQYTSDGWTFIKTKAKDGWQKFLDFINWDEVKEMFKLGWNYVKERTLDGWDYIKTKASDGWSAFLEIIHWEDIKETFRKGWNNVKESTSEAWTLLKEKFRTGWEDVKTKTFSGINYLTDKFGPEFTRISNKFEETWDGMKEKFRTGWEDVKTKTFSGINYLTDKFGPEFTRISNKFEETWDGMKDKISNWWDEVKPKINALRESFVMKFEEIKEDLIAFFGLTDTNSIILGIAGRISDWWSYIKSDVLGFSGDFVDEFDVMNNDLVRPFRAVRGGIITRIVDYVSDWAEYIGNPIDNFIDAVKAPFDISGYITEMFSNDGKLGTTFRESIHDWGANIDAGIGIYIIEKIKAPFLRAFGWIEEIFKVENLVAVINGSIKAALELLPDWAKDFFDVDVSGGGGKTSGSSVNLPGSISEMINNVIEDTVGKVSSGYDPARVAPGASIGTSQIKGPVRNDGKSSSSISKGGPIRVDTGRSSGSYTKKKSSSTTSSRKDKVTVPDGRGGSVSIKADKYDTYRKNYKKVTGRDLPKLERGGIVTRNQMIEAGEKNKPEAILPLTGEAMQPLVQAIAQEVIAQQGTQVTRGGREEDGGVSATFVVADRASLKRLVRLIEAVQISEEQRKGGTR